MPFTDKEFKEILKAKHKLKNGDRLGWRSFIIKLASMVNNGKEI